MRGVDLPKYRLFDAVGRLAPKGDLAAFEEDHRLNEEAEARVAAEGDSAPFEEDHRLNEEAEARVEAEDVSAPHPLTRWDKYLCLAEWKYENVGPVARFTEAAAQ